MSEKTIAEIRAALKTIHDVALGRSEAAYMSIPADPNRDADLILSAAIDELEELREKAPAEEGLAGFEKELAALINRYSLEGRSNTPDFILAEYLACCLGAFNVACRAREADWRTILFVPGRSTP